MACPGYTSCYSKNHPSQKPQVMIRVIHQRTSLCKNSLFSECLNLIKGKLKKKTWPIINSFPFPSLAPSLHYRQASGQNALYASPQTCTISHSLNKHPLGQAQGRRCDSDTDAVPFRWGACRGARSQGRGGAPEPRHSAAARECAGAARSAGKDKASEPRHSAAARECAGAARSGGRTRHPRLTRQRTQTRRLRTSAGGVRDDRERKKETGKLARGQIRKGLQSHCLYSCQLENVLTSRLHSS